MHILPQLRKLEEKHREKLDVIGVHSAKFDAEKATANIAEAVARYNVRHPVVIDRDQDLWMRYECRSWPTIALIDGQGRLRFHGGGEPDVINGSLQKQFQVDAPGLLFPFDVQERGIEEIELRTFHD